MIPDLLDIQLQHSLNGRFDKGWECIQRLEKERFWCNRVKFNAGWYHLRNGNLKKGMELINQGRFENVFGSGHIGSPMPIYDGRPLNHENVLLHLEGGFGDEVIGFRYAKEIKKRGGNPIVICHKYLHSLLKYNHEQTVLRHNNALLIPHSYWMPGMASELILGYENWNEIPSDKYIEINPVKIEDIPLFKTDKVKVGIKWSGNPQFEHEQHRIFPFDLFYNAVNNEKVQLYSLQIEHDLDLPDNIIDLKSIIKTWEDTAAIVNDMDLIISSCTGLAHLAAAMGKMTWIIVPILSYYVWAYPREKDQYGELTWYYDSARLFRQEKYGTWEEPMNNIKNSLEEFLK